MKETTVDDSVSSQLTIHQATSTDSGKYVCIATNPFGRDEMAVYLSVQGKSCFEIYLWTINNFSSITTNKLHNLKFLYNQ